MVQYDPEAGLYARLRSAVKVGDRATIDVIVTRVEEPWVTFTIRGYVHPLTMYDPEFTYQFTVTVPVKSDGLLHPEDYNELRNRCAAKFNDQAVAPFKQRLPVIFCNFK